MVGRLQLPRNSSASKKTITERSSLRVLAFYRPLCRGFLLPPGRGQFRIFAHFCRFFLGGYTEKFERCWRENGRARVCTRALKSTARSGFLCARARRSQALSRSLRYVNLVLPKSLRYMSSVAHLILRSAQIFRSHLDGW